MFATLDVPDDPTRYVRVAHPEAAGGENLIEVSRRDPEAKRLVVGLANRGFMLYVTKEGESRFAHRGVLPELWGPLKDNTYQMSDEGIIYEWTEPALGGKPKSLLVVFSAMNRPIYMTGLGRHFTRNYAKIHQHVPGHTAVLRIADLGGVVGSYYLDTVAYPNNADAVQGFLRDIAERSGVPHHRVVLLGSSKGASASVYHAVRGGFRFVAVDPVLEDTHYVRDHNDAHFTVGVFPESKDVTFARLAQDRPVLNSVSESTVGAAITSEASAQYETVKAYMARWPDSVAVLDVRDRRIRSHPDVAPTSMYMTSSLVNLWLEGLPFPPGYRVIGDV